MGFFSRLKKKVKQVVKKAKSFVTKPKPKPKPKPKRRPQTVRSLPKAFKPSVSKNLRTLTQGRTTPLPAARPSSTPKKPATKTASGGGRTSSRRTPTPARPAPSPPPSEFTGGTGEYKAAPMISPKTLRSYSELASLLPIGGAGGLGGIGKTVLPLAKQLAKFKGVDLKTAIQMIRKSKLTPSQFSKQLGDAMQGERNLQRLEQSQLSPRLPVSPDKLKYTQFIDATTQKTTQLATAIKQRGKAIGEIKQAQNKIATIRNTIKQNADKVEAAIGDVAAGKPVPAWMKPRTLPQHIKHTSELGYYFTKNKLKNIIQLAAKTAKNPVAVGTFITSQIGMWGLGKWGELEGFETYNYAAKEARKAGEFELALDIIAEAKDIRENMNTGIIGNIPYVKMVEGLEVKGKANLIYDDSIEASIHEEMEEIAKQEEDPEPTFSEERAQADEEARQRELGYQKEDYEYYRAYQEDERQAWKDAQEEQRKIENRQQKADRDEWRKFKEEQRTLDKAQQEQNQKFWEEYQRKKQEGALSISESFEKYKKSQLKFGLLGS